MLSEKSLSFEKADGIPVPAAQNPIRRRSILKPIVKCAIVVLAIYALHVWTFRPLVQWARQSTGSNVMSKGHGKEKILIGRKAEKLFLSIPNEESALAASRLYATKPHLAGSPQDLLTAKLFLELLLSELGIDSPYTAPIFSAGSPESRNATLSIPHLTGPQAWIDVYYPVLNTPLDRSLEILGDNGEVVWKADLEEKTDETDPEAGKYGDAVPAWHGLSRGGEVEGKLVYANYGRKEDYDALVADGVDLNGAIVIARYGGIFRGLKVKRAEELGAVGVLIYSDPRDDGTVTSANGYATYPDGPARNPFSVQRGSVQFLSIYPGDPTTPGYPAYENSTRTEGSNIPAIPSLPISWANAEVLLKELREGGLGRRVKLVNHVDDKVTPIWNTLGVIPGHIRNEVVVIGNHRDAWVMGATDPSSGTASLNEVIRGFGALMKKGWRPLRTILIASWDAEEYGLIGSTEWGEDFSDWIDEHVVAYLNLDSSVSGSHFSASASPSLAHFVRSTAEELPHPTRNKSEGLTLWDATKDSGTLFGDRADGQIVWDEGVSAFHEADLTSDSVGVRPLGSGSDFTVFLQRIGVASAHAEFTSTLHDPVYHYHSVFDSERWQEIYGDPGFFRHVAVAKHLGLQALRLSSSIIIPLNTTHYAHELGYYVQKVEMLASSEEKTIELNLTALRESIRSLQSASHKLDIEKVKAERRLIHLLEKIGKRRCRSERMRRKMHKMGRRIKNFFRRSCHHIPIHHENDTLDSTVKDEDWGTNSRIGRLPGWLNEHRDRPSEIAHAFALHAGLDFTSDDNFPTSVNLPPGFPIRKLVRAVKRVQAANRKLIGFERGFISEGGIKDREWYRHLGVAPGKWLGYGATTLPGLTEAITIDRNATAAEYEAGRLTELIQNLTKKLEAGRAKKT